MYKLHRNSNVTFSYVFKAAASEFPHCCRHAHTSGGFELFPSKAYINGQWVDSASSKSLKVTNPANGNMLGTVPDCNVDDLNAAVQAAENAFKVWSGYSAEVNCHFFRYIHH